MLHALAHASSRLFPAVPLVAGLLNSCGPAPQPLPNLVPPRAAIESPRVPSTSAEASPTENQPGADFQVELRALPRDPAVSTLPAPSLELRLGATFEDSRVQVSASTLDAVQHILLLDNQPPHAVSNELSVDLSALLGAAEVQAGTHRVVAAAVSQGFRPVATARYFSFEAATRKVTELESAPGSGLVLLGPHGTLNGPDANSAETARLDYLLLGDDSKKAEVTVELRGPFGASDAKALESLGSSPRESRPAVIRQSASQPPYALDGLVSGDYELSLVLAGSQANSWLARAHAKFTVNRDLVAPTP